MSVLYIAYHESEKYTPDDEDGYGDRHITFRIEGVYVVEPNDLYRHERVEVEWDPLELRQAIVLVRRYEDGSTFGTSYGCWEILGAFKTITEARLAREAAEKRYKDAYDYGTTFETYPCMVFF